MTSHRDAERAIADALRRGEYERVALALLLGVASAARSVPEASIDDLLAVLSDDVAPDTNGRGLKARATDRLRRRNGGG